MMKKIKVDLELLLNQWEHLEKNTQSYILGESKSMEGSLAGSFYINHTKVSDNPWHALGELLLNVEKLEEEEGYIGDDTFTSNFLIPILQMWDAGVLYIEEE